MTHRWYRVWLEIEGKMYPISKLFASRHSALRWADQGMRDAPFRIEPEDDDDGG
jgi:hypothetical protein